MELDPRNTAVAVPHLPRNSVLPEIGLDAACGVAVTTVHIRVAWQPVLNRQASALDCRTVVGADMSSASDDATGDAWLASLGLVAEMSTSDDLIRDRAAVAA